MSMRRRNIQQINRRGGALLAVLAIVCAITILSLGFLTRSDVELASGMNMILRTEMDYLAESGLEHARGLVLNPQDASGEYWYGTVSQQLIEGSNDYYDVSVTKVGECDYQLNSTAYRKNGSEQIARSSLSANLRLNPCVAYLQSLLQAIPAQVTVNGDVYIGDSLTNFGTINGDIYLSKTVANLTPGSIKGKRFENAASAPVSLPGLATSDFSSQYYINNTAYTVQTLPVGLNQNLSLTPSANNPAGIYYCNGSLELKNCTIGGMIVVKDDLKLWGTSNVTITAVKNFPALLVGRNLSFEENGVPFRVTGLAQVNGYIDMKSKTGSSLTVNGALYVLGNGIKNTTSCTVTVTGVPNKAAIQLWPNAGTARRWSPAGGAFYKSITRQ